MDVPRLPDSLKFIKRFLVQANQVERSKHPLVAYYLRLYAVTLALKLPKEQRDRSIMLYINNLMDELEKLKGELDPLDKETDRIAVEEFAAQLFDFADRTDRAGNATKNTALGFSAASVVFECLEYFGPLEPEIIERIRYAKWKAADIAKALKNGQTPIPGPYNQLESTEPVESTDSIPPPSYDLVDEHKSNDVSVPVSSFTSASIPRNLYQAPDLPSFRATESTAPPPAAISSASISSATVPSAPFSSARSNSVTSSSRRLSLDDEKRYYAMITDAEKKTSQALASIRFKDWNGAEALLLSVLEQVRSIRSLKP